MLMETVDAGWVGKWGGRGNWQALVCGLEEPQLVHCVELRQLTNLLPREVQVQWQSQQRVPKAQVKDVAVADQACAGMMEWKDYFGRRYVEGMKMYAPLKW